MGVLALAGCGGSSHSASTPAPSGPPLTGTGFATVLPKGWQKTVVGSSLCGSAALACIFTDQGSASGAGATIGVNVAPHEVPDSKLATSLEAAVKRIGGQNVRVRQATVAGAPAVVADFSTTGGGYAAANWQSIHINHAGKTYSIDLQAAQQLAGHSAAKLWHTSFLPALQSMLAAWRWR